MSGYRDPAGSDPVDPAGFVWTTGRRRALYFALPPLLTFALWCSIGLGWASWLSALRCAVAGLAGALAFAGFFRAMESRWPWVAKDRS